MTGYRRKVRYALGLLFVLAATGCQNPRRQKSDYYTEMAKHTAYDVYSQPSAGVSQAVSDPWICPMHPQIQQTQPGKCSICGMALIRESDPSPTTAAPLDSHPASADESPPRSSGCCG